MLCAKKQVKPGGVDRAAYGRLSVNGGRVQAGGTGAIEADTRAR